MCGSCSRSIVDGIKVAIGGGRVNINDTAKHERETPY